MNWCSLEGARKKKRKLYLEPDDEGSFLCPVSKCLHVGFKTQRGLRKHINTKHEWYFYFDTEPLFNRGQAEVRTLTKLKASTHNKVAYSIDNGCGLDFVNWLQTPCGGGKQLKEAKQIGTRAMKFLMYSLGECESGTSAQESYIDCCVASPQMLMKFLKILGDEWGLKSTGVLSYLKAVADLSDYRKCQGLPDETLRLFAITEVYIRRSKSTLNKKKNVEYTRDLTLEKLIARDSWATLEDMEKVIPYHSPKYQYLLRKCQQKGNNSNPLTVSEIACATRFIITFLFLRVKCTRPMSLQFLTTTMVDLATKNDGFIDQTEFKTKDGFIFDSLKFTTDALEVIKSFITNIRPLCAPKCEYVILTSKGTQYTAFGNAMSLLVHQAIGKHITPTRYRQIVESESVTRLSPSKQKIINKDQKHSSYVAKRCYQKKLSREIAEEGHGAMTELVGEDRDIHTKTLASEIREAIAYGNENAAEEEGNTLIVPDEEIPACSLQESPNSLSDPILIDENTPSTSGIDDLSCTLTTMDDIDVKKEELQEEGKNLLFTPLEDSFLKAGFEKHDKSRSKWADILKDEEYKFYPGRTRDALRMRAKTLKLTKEKTSKRSKGNKEK